MLARSFVLASLLAVTACGSRARPAPTTPGGSTSTAPATAASTSLTIDGAAWTLDLAGTVTEDPEDGHRIAAAAFELSLMGWPRSEAFVQTLGEHLQGFRENGASLEVLHQVDGGTYSFEAVVATGGVVDGTVLVPDPDGGDGAMCGFKLAPGADWHAALDACKSLRRAGE